LNIFCYLLIILIFIQVCAKNSINLQFKYQKFYEKVTVQLVAGT
jgi:hypothetical protein